MIQNTLLVILVGSTLGGGFVAQRLSLDYALSDSSQISLITIKPGESLDQRFGHSAIRVYDPVQKLDLLFNYGTFEFDDLFVARFIYGKLDYYLSIAPFQDSIEKYREQNRPVIRQVLNLNLEQRRALYRFLLDNAQKKNRYYRYDFLFDNCSTRIRDALGIVLQDDLHYTFEQGKFLTFRELLDPFMADRSFLDFGVDLILGAPVDHVAKPLQSTFLPDHLMFAFEGATIKYDTDFQNLTVRTDTLLWIEGYTKKAETPWPFILSMFLLITGALASYRSLQHGSLKKLWLDLPLFGFAGFLGLLISFLWFVSLHHTTASNWNLMWAWPTHLLITALLIRRKSPTKWMRWYFLFSSLVVLVTLVAGIARAFYIHPAVIPLLLLVALRGSVYGFWRETGPMGGELRFDISELIP